MLWINLLIWKTAANKQSDIFLRIIHNICKTKLTLLGTFHSTFHRSLYKTYMTSFWTEPFLNFWIFMKKYPCKKNKIRKNCFDKQEKFWTYLKMFWKKRKNFKANWVLLAHSKPNFFPSANHGGRHLFYLGPPTILQLLRSWVCKMLQLLLT